MNIVLFDPTSQPYQGIFSFPSPLSIGLGRWAQVQNFRTDDMVIRVRDGSAAFTPSAAVSGGAFRGSWSGLLNDTHYLVAAYRHSSETKIYTVNLSTGAWTERTRATGKYDNTRFATDGFVCFQAVRDRQQNRDVLVINNGSDDPRIYDPLAVGANEEPMAIHSTIEFPTANYSVAKSIATFNTGQIFTVGGTSTGLATFTNSAAARFAGAMNGSDPDNNVRLSVDSTITVNDNVILTWSSGRTLASSRQLQMYTASGSLPDEFWKNVKLEIGTASGYTVIYDWDDPAYNTYTKIADTAHPGYQTIAFALGHVSPRTGIDRLRFTFTGTAPLADYTYDIFCMVGSGPVVGGSSHAIGYFHGGSRAESWGYVVPESGSSKIWDLGGTKLDHATFPVSSLLFYDYLIYYQKVSQAQLDLGIDQIRAYRKEPGETTYKFCEASPMGTYNAGAGTWSFSGAGALAVAAIGDSTATELRDVSLTAPDSFHKPIPRGTCMHFANSRLFVGGINDDGSAARGDVYISADSHPFRFRKFTIGNDPSSPTRLTFDAEVMGQIASVATSTLGAQQIYLLTNRAIYTVDGLTAFQLSRPTKIAPIGTLSPRSVAEHQGTLYFVDNEKQVRRLAGGQIENLSRATVEDKFRGIPAGFADDICGLFFRDRYYVGYTPSGATANSRVLVFNSIFNMWESDDLLPSPLTAEQLLKVYNGASSNHPYILMSFAADAKAYRFDDPTLTTDLGSSIAVSLTSHEVIQPAWKAFTIKRAQIFCDSVTGGSVSVLRTFRPTGGTSSSSINIDDTSPQAWRIDGAVPPTITNDARGWSGQVTFSSSIPGGKKIYGLAIELDDRDDVAEVV